MKFLLWFICYTCSTLAMAQQVSLIIQVSDGDKPVAFASVGITELKKGGVADESGKFQIQLNPGTYTIQVTAIGKLKYTEKLVVKEGNLMHHIVVLKPDPSALDEVTVSGTLKETGKMNSAVPVELYQSKFFLKNPVSGMFEALSMVNGVQPTINCNVCNTGDIHLNGMEGPYTLVMIDGMPIVSALSTVYGLSGIPNSMIERIEIVKGPASTLYGSEAVAGLINVITKRTDKAPKYFADMFGTGMGDNNLDLGWSLKRKNWSTLTGFNFASSPIKWDKNNDHFTDMALYNRFSIFNKITYRSSPGKESTIALRYYHEDRYGGDLNFNQSMRGSDSIYGESIYTDRIELIGNYRMPVEESLRLMYSYNWHKQDAFYSTRPFNAEQQTAFAQLVWDGKLSDSHDFTSGICLRYTYYNDNTPATLTSVIRWLPGIFAQDEWYISPKVSLLSGVRYDYFKDHGSIISPRLNLRFKPSTLTTFRLSCGNGFRVVNLFTEDHQALTGARKVLITQDLKPETSWNLNVNLVRIIPLNRSNLTLDATAFYTHFTNRIMADYDTDPALIIYSNLKGYAVSKGISLNTDFNLPPQWNISNGITFMQVYKVENLNGHDVKIPQIHAPEFMSTFQVSYTFKKLPVKIDYSGLIYGPMRLPLQPNDFRPEYSPWFTLQNIQFTYTYKSKWQIYLGVKNIFDFTPSYPIMRPFDPFNKKVNENNPNGWQFDTGYNYAPLQFRRGFIGLRLTIN